ncbi:MAG: hypothetical protein ACQEWF_22260 [Bacillota bacterium]
MERATQMVKGNLEVWKEMIEDFRPFEDIEVLGSEVQYSFPNTESVRVKLTVHTQDVVPEHVLSLTKTGKVSERKMAKGKYLQLYQDYVCSCVLRIGREFINLLPIQNVVIDVYDHSLEEVAELGCILSIKLDRDRVGAMDFTSIDCSDVVETFNPNMTFLKTKGFKYVEELA